MISLAVKGLRPAITTIVMPMNPQDFEEARQRAILADKTIISTTPPVAAYIHLPSDARVDELTKMVKDLQTKLDEKGNQASAQQQQPQRQQHRDKKRHWRKQRDWQQNPNWNWQGAQEYWQRSNNQNWQQGQQQYQGPAQQQHPCPGCRGEDLNCNYPGNYPGKCWSNNVSCNNCGQKGHYAKVCPNQAPR